MPKYNSIQPSFPSTLLSHPQHLHRLLNRSLYARHLLLNSRVAENYTAPDIRRFPRLPRKDYGDTRSKLNGTWEGVESSAEGFRGLEPLLFYL